jgi:putative SOS response-associated peptidase YedK
MLKKKTALAIFEGQKYFTPDEQTAPALICRPVPQGRRHGGLQLRDRRQINNARSDKLESGMWREAFQEHRCVIPMSMFYEWGPDSGAAGQRLAGTRHMSSLTRRTTTSGPPGSGRKMRS